MEKMGFVDRRREEKRLMHNMRAEDTDWCIALPFSEAPAGHVKCVRCSQIHDLRQPGGISWQLLHKRCGERTAKQARGQCP